MRILPLLIVALCSPVLAVGTSYWTQPSEADFKAGTLENVVASNLGDLKLSRAVKVLLEEDPRISSVYALAEGPDGTIYAGTGPRGILLAIKDGKTSTLLDLGESTNVLSLLVDRSGAILIGTGGQEGRILRIDKPGDKPRELFRDDKAQYIWAMAQTPDGNLYAATGPEGMLFEIKPDGSKKVLLDSDENNLLSLISDGKDLLYVGADPHGLVYRVNRKSGESFVLYNAGESEISALALDKQGNLYAATAEAQEEGVPARMPAASEQRFGRPESGPAGSPLPSNHPKEPSPPPPPENDPNRPNPIPRGGKSAGGSGAGKVGFEGGLLMREAASGGRKAGRLISLSRYSGGGLGWGFDGNAEWRNAGLFLNSAFSIQHSLFSRAPTLTLPRSTGRGDQSTRVLLVEDNKLADAPPGNPRKRPRPGPGNPGPGPGNPEPGPVPGLPMKPTTGAARRPQPIDTGGAGEARPEGNAVYRIDPNGFVTEIFRQDVLILAMVENNGALLLATGSDEQGQIYQVRPEADESLVLAKVDSKQILCLLPSRDGKIYMGMANEGSVASMSGGFASKGTYVSPVLDATQISRFGKMQLHGTLPPNTALTVATRSGNLKEAQDKGWSSWSEETPAAEYLPIASPSARFLQYRLTFNSNDGKATPVVEDLTIAYQIPNLPPKISSIRVAGAGAGSSEPGEGASESASPPKRAPANPQLTVSWEASDPNNDNLAYALYFRRVGEEPWILLKDKLTEATFDWNTRTVADGRYEVRVVASDAASNPPGQGKTASRISDPVLVDNTPPAIGDLKWKQLGAAIQVDLKAADRTSTVAAVEYSVDSNKDWQLVLPVDGIYDSPEETVTFSIANLPPGKHQVTLRATDVKGNEGFESLFVTVAGPTAEAKK
jgi:hypothetical protein